MKSGNRQEPIRMCFIAPKAYPLFNPNVKEYFGGAEVDLYLLATELAKDESFSVSFITADYGQEEIEKIEDVSVIKSVVFKKSSLCSAVKIWRVMRQADAAMYMIKTISEGMFLTALFCFLHNKKFIYRTAHSTHCDGTYLRHHPIKGNIFKCALRTAQLVFVQNKTDAKNLKQSTGVESIVIPNGHRLIQSNKQERSIILWVGRSAGFKRPELFIELAERLPNEQFIMICQRATGDETYNQLLARAKQTANLEFIERVPFNEIDKYFLQAKVFVNTSESEGFANTFIQACKCGTPILSLNVNPDGFLDKYNCGICCDNNFEKLVESLKSLLDNDSYKQLGLNARKYAEENHDIKKIVEQYKKAFQGIL